MSEYYSNWEVLGIKPRTQPGTETKRTVLFAKKRVLKGSENKYKKLWGWVSEITSDRVRLSRTWQPHTCNDQPSSSSDSSVLHTLETETNGNESLAK